MANKALEISNLSKQYQLGEVGTGTLSHDLNRWWAKMRGKEDPYSKVGVENDRSIAGGDFVWALQNVSFEVNQGDVVGIIGKNGAGKSTLLKLLSRITSPTTGTIKAKGRIASLLEVGTGFHPELTGRENIYLNGAIMGMTKREIASKLDEIVDFSGCAKYLDTPVKRYSSGMTVRMGFAVAAHLESEILIVDEVLAVGDAEFQKKAIGKMQEVSSGQGRTVLFVSHNMSSIRNLCEKGIVLTKGGVTFNGNVGEAISNYLSDGSEISTKLKEDIPDQLSKFNSGEAKFTKVSILNSKKVKGNAFKYQDKLTVKIQVRILKSLKNVCIMLAVRNQYAEEIAYSFSANRNKLLEFTPGLYELEFDLPINFMPGNYGLSMSITHFHTGNAIDYIEYFYPFKIAKETLTGDFEYPWKTGYRWCRLHWKFCCG